MGQLEQVKSSSTCVQHYKSYLLLREEAMIALRSMPWPNKHVWRTWFRLHKVGPIFFGKLERRVYAAWAYTLVVAVVTFGAACGIVAAALTFGAYEHYAASYGQRLRTAASYVSVSSKQLRHHFMHFHLELDLLADVL